LGKLPIFGDRVGYKKRELAVLAVKGVNYLLKCCNENLDRGILTPLSKQHLQSSAASGDKHVSHKDISRHSHQLHFKKHANAKDMTFTSAESYSKLLLQLDFSAD